MAHYVQLYTHRYEMLMNAVGMPSILYVHENKVVLHKILHLLQSAHLCNVTWCHLCKYRAKLNL